MIMNLTGVDAIEVICNTMSSMTPTTTNMRDNNKPPIRITKRMQLIDAAKATTDVEVHVCCSGDGVVELSPSPIYDLSDFVPLEYFGAWYVEMDYTEGFAEIVHDFLDE